MRINNITLWVSLITSGFIFMVCLIDLCLENNSTIALNIQLNLMIALTSLLMLKMNHSDEIVLMMHLIKVQYVYNNEVILEETLDIQSLIMRLQGTITYNDVTYKIVRTEQLDTRAHKFHLQKVEGFI